MRPPQATKGVGRNIPCPMPTESVVEFVKFDRQSSGYWDDRAALAAKRSWAASSNFRYCKY
jgi:hypothetical protein